MSNIMSTQNIIFFLIIGTQNVVNINILSRMSNIMSTQNIINFVISQNVIETQDVIKIISEQNFITTINFFHQLKIL